MRLRDALTRSAAALCAVCGRARFEAFSDSLRLEMRCWGVKVVIVEPGFFRTPLVQAGVAQHRRLFMSLPQEMQERYGMAWFERYLKRMGGIERLAGDPSVVVSALADAVKLHHPPPRMQLGIDCRYVFTPLWVLPTRVKDFLVTLFMRDPPEGAK